MPRFTIDMSKDLDRRLSEIAKDKETTKGEVMRKAFTLLSIAEEERKKNGYSVGIIKDAGNGRMEVVTRVVGL